MTGTDADAPAAAVGEPFFRALFEAAPDGCLITDIQGDILLANPAAHALFGYAPGTLPGQSVEVLLPARFRDAHREHRRRFTQQPRRRTAGVNVELWGLRADGEEFPAEITLAPLNFAGAALVVAAVRDVGGLQRTRRSEARGRFQENVTRLGHRALASKDLAEFIAGVPALLAEGLAVEHAAVLMLDRARTRFVCRAATGVAGPIAHLDQANDGSTLAGAVVLSAKPVVRRCEALPCGGPGHAGVACAAVPVWGRGEAIGALLAWDGSQARFDADQITFMQAMANTVSDAIARNEAEEQLAHARRLEALGQLTGGIAHDFNNLLTVILGNLQVIGEQAGDAPHLAELAAAASRAAERGAELTRKLLAFSRRQMLQPRVVHIDELLLPLAEMLHRTLPDNLEVITEIRPGLPPVFVDPALMESAVLNLALNARDAMPRGGRLVIQAQAEQLAAVATAGGNRLAPGHYVVLTVSDTGSGMTPDVLSRAFEPFFTTKGSRGSGLGLATVYGFVRQSGGDIRVDSEPSAGSTFRIYLPPAEEELQGPPQASPLESLRGSETILVVEDNDDVREVALRFLADLGYRPLPAADAAAALALLARHPEISVLFSDVMLPTGMSGPELAQEARLRHPGLKVLFTSGYPREAFADSGFIHPPADVLLKPYGRVQLGDRLRRLIERAGLQ